MARRARADGARAATGPDAASCPVASILGRQTLILEDFPYPDIARILSPNGRAHWATKNAARVGVGMRVFAAVAGRFEAPVRSPVRLLFRYTFPDHRKRDVDNLTTGVTKSVIDSLVRAGVLEADDSEHVTEVKAEAVVEKGRRCLEVTIAPAEQARDGREAEVVDTERLAEIRARVERATAGPWHVTGLPGQWLAADGYETGMTYHVFESAQRGDGECSSMLKEDAEFVAHARVDVPDLLAEVARLTAALARATEEREALREAGRAMLRFLDDDAEPSAADRDMAEHWEALLAQAPADSSQGEDV
jgi:hypothetical protein